MKLSSIAIFAALLLLDQTKAAGLRRVKEQLNFESLSLNDEFAPSIAPTSSETEQPSLFPSLSPSGSVSPSLSPSLSTGPSFSPSGIPVTNASYSGGDSFGNTFIIEIRLDNNFLQNAWHVFSGSGATKRDIYSRDFGTLKSGGIHRTVFENMPAGVYTFAIVDVGNDGLGSSGGMAIYKSVGGQQTTLWERDGIFSFLVEKTFFIS